MAKRTITLWFALLAGVFLSLAVIARAGAASFTLDHAGKISLETPDGWIANARFSDPVADTHALDLEIFPAAQKNQAVAHVKALLHIAVSKIVLFPPWDQRCAIVRDVFTQRFGKPKVDLTPYKIAQGRGIYFVFLDPKLVDKPTQPGCCHYKVVSPGLVDLNNGRVQIIANLYADDADGPDMTALRSIVESIRFTPPANP